MAATRAELKGLPLLQLERAETSGLRPAFHGNTEWENLFGDYDYYDLWIDAVLGTGAKGEPEGSAAEAIDWLRTTGWKTLAVDVPSGIDTDTGAELGNAVQANWTVTFGLPKPFLFQGKGLGLSGEWEVADIGFPKELLDERRGARLLDRDFQGALPAREKTSHKGDNGHVLILAGSRKYRGAATLAALGALKAGAGLVTVASIEPVLEAVAAQVPEAIFLPLPETDGVIDSYALDALRKAKDSFTSCVIGPGLTTAPEVKYLLKSLWKDWWVPTVVDADALNLVAQGLELPNGLCILTPHPGEAGRLLGTDSNTVQANRFKAARDLFEKYRWPVVLKGAHSIAALDTHPLYVNSTGNPGMATGGMGDVLAGVIAALLPDPLAGAKGMYWHGLAGDLCAREKGEIGFSASELAQFLPLARSNLSK